MIKLDAVYKRLTVDQKINKVKVKGWKKILHANTNQKRDEVTILV